jgi:hypothetical protein
MILLPTGECFSDACTYIEEIAKRDEPLEGYSIVHAICLAPDQPELGMFAHGWVEKGEAVVFKSVVGEGPLKGEEVWVTADRKSFYGHLHIQQPRRYELSEVAYWNRKTGNMGPWEEPYVSFTRQGKGKA